MLLSILRMLRGFVQTITEKDAPQRIAFSVALGMMIGLVPKGNLVAIVLSAVLFAARTNLVAGAMSAAAFSWIGMLLDPLAHRFGLFLLTRDALEPYWTRFHELPLVPWTCLNNTVVLGSLLMGVVLFYPTYRLTRLGVERYRERIAAKVERYQAARVLAQAETATKWRVR